MNRRLGGSLVAAALVLAACGRPDASGVYLARSDRQATLLQLTQGKDGAVRGRVEVVGIGPGGIITDQTASLEGAATSHDLAFKPAGAWFGGARATGSFTRDALTLGDGGSALTARKATPEAFEKAVAQLKVKAAAERRKTVEAQAAQAGQAAETGAIADAADKAGRLRRAASELRSDAIKLDQAVAAAPDYGQRSAENTARVAALLQTAPTLSRAERGRLSASAGDIAVATNQIEIARYQYATGLDPIVQHGSPMAMAVQQFCGAPEAAPYAKPCADAEAAATDFQRSEVHAAVVFKGYKQTVRQEMARQNEMARKIGGG